jgi:hypothetical protein
MKMNTYLKKFWRGLLRACVELIESESGEFMTTRQKSLLLDAMMRDQRERNQARAAAHAESNEPPLSVAHSHSI